MPTYLDRYLAGEHEQVWDELMALGVAVREEPLYTDALAVARETMRRARYNVEIIVARLRANGYLFAYPKAVYVPATKDDISELDKIEAEVGVIPISLRVWYETVSSVFLAGENLGDYRLRLNEGCLEVTNSNFSMYGFFIRGHKAYSDIEEELRRVHYSEKDRIVGISIMDDDLIMAGEESGLSEVIAPDKGADGRFLLPKYNIAPTFVGYLRKCFAWGGFPGFADVDESLRPTEMLAQLTEGLLPI